MIPPMPTYLRTLRQQVRQLEQAGTPHEAVALLARELEATHTVKARGRAPAFTMPNYRRQLAAVELYLEITVGKPHRHEH